MFNRILFALPFFLTSILLQAQDTSRFHFGVHTQTTLSFTGWRQSVNLEFVTGNNRFYGGSGFSISDTYFPAHTSKGWQLGYRRIFVHDKNWISTAGFHIQSLYGAKQNGIYPQTYEAFLNYGLGYTAGRWAIVNTLGFGGYVERFYNTGFREKQTIEGYNFMLNLMVGYTF